MSRYDNMEYRRCGRSGLKLPKLSLGLWHNFGSEDDFENMRAMLRTAFDEGITHFDLANNYGPIPGSAESNFGRILKEDLAAHRDELIISTKAGHLMWEGPYGDWGSRKSLMASIDQSLRRMNLDYVDIFYSHRPDPDTPLEETMGALSDIVKSGKALYVGISKYSAAETLKAAEILKANGTPLLIHQFRYNMLTRGIEEDGLLGTLEQIGAGGIAFSSLAQGLLTDKYLSGIPEGSRAAKNGFLKAETITKELREKLKRLNEFAVNREMSLAEMAIKWNLRDRRVSSALIGASSSKQIQECVKAVRTVAELSSWDIVAIEGILKGNIR